MTTTENDMERLARAMARGIGYDYDTLYANKTEWIKDRGSRHDINTPRKPDMIEGVCAIVEELLAMLPDHFVAEPAPGGVRFAPARAVRVSTDARQFLRSILDERTVDSEERA